VARRPAAAPQRSDGDLRPAPRCDRRPQPAPAPRLDRSAPPD